MNTGKITDEIRSLQPIVGAHDAYKAGFVDGREAAAKVAEGATRLPPVTYECSHGHGTSGQLVECPRCLREEVETWQEKALDAGNHPAVKALLAERDTYAQILNRAKHRVERLEKSLECIAERAGRMKGEAEGDRPFASATQACAWIEKECRGLLAASSVQQPTATDAELTTSSTE